MSSEPLDLKAVQKGLLAFVSATVMILALGLAGVMLSDAADFHGEYYIDGVTLAGLFYGGAVAGKRAAGGGWRHGMFTGGVGGILILALANGISAGIF